MQSPKRICTKIFPILAAVLALAACATGPTPSQRNDAEVSTWLSSLPEPGADYGPYPNNYGQIVTAVMAATLKDPDSAKYSSFSAPSHDQMVEIRYPPSGQMGVNKQAIYGYAVCVSVNARNSFGGYTGDQRYWLLIRNGQVVRTEPVGALVYRGHIASC